MNPTAKMLNKNRQIQLTSLQFSLLIALFFVAIYNSAFFAEVFNLIDYTAPRGALFILNIALVLWLLTFIIVSLLTIGQPAKIILGAIFIIAAGTAYFMNDYGIVIHRLMIQNMMETDISEVKGLISSRLIIYIVFLGVIPTLLLLKINIHYATFKTECWRKAKYIAIAFSACLLLIISMSIDYASFFRNHKNIRQMANPLNFIYAGIDYASARQKITEVKAIETDAVIGARGKAQSKPALLILVVGETARADHFGTNGYTRDTTPLLGQQNIINFPKVTSCGTETAVSVPCMFSNLGRSNYSDYKGKTQQGLLDVIHHAAIDVLWRDNNSSCKGTCDRVAYEDMRLLKVPELCNNNECFDEILLHQLDDRVAAMKGDRVIVLHQKGSHGPDYFNRHPETGEFFQPECKSNQLQQCTTEEVVNAFDNTIRYTDYFLNKTIEWLKSKNSQYNTSLVYLSDHGESLGENNLYLHGMPYAIAPKEQKHVPFFLWLSDDYASGNSINRECLKELSGAAYSQDNLFHTVLGMLDVETQVYSADLDILKPCRQGTGNALYAKNSGNP